MEQTSSKQGQSKSGGTQSRILNGFSAFLHWFEVGLAALSVVFMGLGVFHLFGQLAHFQEHVELHGLHGALEIVLKDILFVVIGIELAIMLVRRRPESLVELMFFVIARKMLIRTEEFYELLIGVAALSALFAVRKYLQYQPSNSEEDE